MADTDVTKQQAKDVNNTQKMEDKEAKIISKIAACLTKLDADLNEIGELRADSKGSHKVKVWFEEKKAIHEIKKIVHEAGKYEKYDENELNSIADFLKTID